MQTLLENKLETYLERKYRISRSHATRDSYRVIVSRFIDYIQKQYNQDFEQFLDSLKQPDTDPVGILDEYFTFLARRKKPPIPKHLLTYTMKGENGIPYKYKARRKRNLK
ncbi:MAG TPA: hypothetical protein OQH54_02600 [Nitrosopumilus sp.]|nr:hypothetical protein [Nitrosopumilus sp.]